MREPPLNVRLAGHPLTMATVGLGGAGFLYLCWQAPGGQGAIPAIITLCLMAWVGKAHDHMNGYRAWKRAWDGMAGARPRRSFAAGRKALGVVVITLVALYLAAHADDPTYRLALGWMVLVAVGGIVVLLWRAIAGRRQRRQRAAPGPDLVMVCAKPMMKAPSLDAAYCALPDYCHRVMQA